MSNEFGVPPLGGRHFVDNYFTSDFDKWSSALLAAPVVQPPLSGRLYTEKNFWAQFLNDIKTVNKRLIILSPFLSTTLVAEELASVLEGNFVGLGAGCGSG